MKKVALIGDSIREGYQATVRQELAGAAEVWCPPENGGHTVNLFLHFWDWIAGQQPDILHINAGLWDTRHVWHGSAGENVIPLEHYRANVRRLLELTRQHTRARIIWATITPVNEQNNHAFHRVSRFPAHRAADIVAYNAAATAIACELGAGVNDLFSVVERAGAETIRTDDGVHYTEAGYALLGRAVADRIREELAK